MTREKALRLLEVNIKNPNLVKHALAVEVVMDALANYFHQNQVKWRLVGLVHDLDWELTKDNPTKHAEKTVDILKTNGLDDQEIIDAVLSHNYELNRFRPPQNNLEWSLYCCDELTGFIVAVALVQPEKKLSALTAESILKKFPQKSFAAAVKREQIQLCQEKLNIKLEDFISLVLKAMQEIAGDLGL